MTERSETYGDQLAQLMSPELAPGGQVPADAEPAAVLAVRNCPERALSLES